MRFRKALARLRDKKLTWRDIAATPRFTGYPPGTLCAIAKGAPIPNKYHQQTKEPPRVRLVTQVDPALRDRVRAAAEAEGTTVSEWMRQMISSALNKLP